MIDGFSFLMAQEFFIFLILLGGYPVKIVFTWHPTKLSFIGRQVRWSDRGSKKIINNKDTFI
jgi:hypothetical protein